MTRNATSPAVLELLSRFGRLTRDDRVRFLVEAWKVAHPPAVDPVAAPPAVESEEGAS